jgi:hypothetical protein
LGADRVKHFEIHAETQLTPNALTGKVERFFVFDHVVVAGTEPDKAGDLRAVCSAVVDPLPWTSPLRDWLAITETKRCPSCDERVGDEIRRLIELEATGVWGWQ